MADNPYKVLSKRKARPRYWFWTYGPSNTATALREAVGGRTILKEGSKYVARVGDVVINWGNSHRGPFHDCLNNPGRVRVATSKQGTFQLLQGAGLTVPEYTTDPAVARGWLQRGTKVLGRDKDNGSGGDGIRVYHPQKDNDVGRHLFYVKYWKKEREFRIHVWKDTVIFKQEKLKKIGVEDADPYVRSHEFGWVFAFNHLDGNPVPDGVETLGRMAVHHLGLDFGGVDIGWNNKSGPCVFEINTAPGLENTSLQAYANQIKNL